MTTVLNYAEAKAAVAAAVAEQDTIRAAHAASRSAADK